MKKYEFIKALAKKAGITQIKANEFLNAFVDTALTCLKKGWKVALPGFGTFSVQKRSARIGVDPRNPARKIKIPAVRVAKFKTGLRLRKAVK